METIIVISLLSGVVVSVYLRSNPLLVVGSMAFGWVLVYSTSNEAVLFARSLSPIASSNMSVITSLVLGFGPGVAAILLTKKALKQSYQRAMSLFLAPALFIIGWQIILLAVSYEMRSTLLATRTHQLVTDNQEYVLWIATIMFILLLYIARPRVSAEEGKSKKKR